MKNDIFADHLPETGCWKRIGKKLAYVLALCCFLFGIQACTTAETNTAKQLELGYRYLDEMKYEEALIAFSKVIEIDAKTWDAYSGSADAYIGLGENEKAAEILEAALILLENDEVKESTDYDTIRSGFLLRITQLYLAMADEAAGQDQEKALQYYRKLLEINPESEEAVKSVERLTAKRYPDDYLDYGENHDYTEEQFEKCRSILMTLYDAFMESGIEGAETYIADLTQTPGHTTDVSCLIETDFYHGRKAYYGDTDELGRPEGFGAALCDDGFNAQYFVGEWENGQRMSGTLFSSSKTGEIGYYRGGWKNDLPNGHGTMYDFFVDQYYDGEFTDGYFNGDFEITWYTKEPATYSIHFDMGEGEHLQEYEDGSWQIEGKIEFSDGGWINGINQNPGYYYTAWGFPVDEPPKLEVQGSP